MKRVVFKYTLQEATTTHWIPNGAQFLSSGVQGENLVVWYLCDPETVLKQKKFEILMTGEEKNNFFFSRYLGTQQVGLIVCHIFEV